MPLISPPHTHIELPVADRIVADTRIRQKCAFAMLRHTQNEAGECCAHIGVLVTLYAADDAAAEGFGRPLTGPGFSSYAAELVADNNTLVDAQTGAIQAIRQGENDASWRAKIDAFPQPTMLQGDFFEYLRENQPVRIGDMIRQHIQQADAMGRFA